MSFNKNKQSFNNLKTSYTKYKAQKRYRLTRKKITIKEISARYNLHRNTISRLSKPYSLYNIWDVISFIRFLDTRYPAN